MLKKLILFSLGALLFAGCQSVPTSSVPFSNGPDVTPGLSNMPYSPPPSSVPFSNGPDATPVLRNVPSSPPPGVSAS